jgi:hypothetical protein
MKSSMSASKKSGQWPTLADLARGGDAGCHGTRGVAGDPRSGC